jgi:hypothetical protein
MAAKSSQSRLRFPGIIPVAKRTFSYLLYGAPREPKWRHTPGVRETPTKRKDYSNMPEEYRWFRQDEKVRRCVIVNALFATMTAGFETVIEPTGHLSDAEKETIREKYGPIKEQIDEYNDLVKMDRILFVSQVKCSIFGKAGWELVSDGAAPHRLISLLSDKLEPITDAFWQIESFKYQNKEKFYEPEEVLYFTNLELEADHEGLSDIEAINDICKARHDLLRQDFPEITRTLWAPFVILEADTTGMSKAKEDETLDKLIEVARSGKSIVLNSAVKAHVVKMDINFTGLRSMLDDFDESIIANFGTPKFFLGKPIENRATAYAELEAYVEGTIQPIQTNLARQLEAQWLDPLTVKLLEKMGKRIQAGEVLPFHVKLQWKPIRTSDIYEMAKAVAALYANGLGILGEFPEIAFDMMDWEQKILEEWKNEMEEQPETPAPKTPNLPDNEPNQAPGQPPGGEGPNEPA